MITIFGLVAVIGCVALAVDVGTLWTQRREMQAAADAAAVAGDLEIYSGNASDSATALITTAARTDSAKNGFTNGVNGATVTVNAPPQSGPYTGDQYAVEVIVRQAEPTYLLGVLDINSVPISARAVARYSGASGCVYALDPNDDSKTLSLNGSATLTSACTVYVDSSSNDGLDVNGNAKLTATSPATIDVVGSSDKCSGGCSPTPKTDAQAAQNPLASLPVPAEPAVVSSSTLNISAQGHAALQPGTYDGRISVSGGVSVTLNSGLYYLNGGGLNVSGGSTISGAGVTFFNTGAASGATQYKPIDISGGSATSLTAPMSGTYEGVLFFQDPGICAVSSSFCGSSGPQNTISGGSTAAFIGALYFPNTPLYFSGGSGSTDCTELVAYIINISGNASVNNACSEFGSFGPAVKSPTLAE